jgi:K+-transporting ATPase ATPase A chain
MTSNGWLQIALFGVIVIVITRLFGGYMTRVFAGEWTPLSPLLRPVERFVYWCCGVDEAEEQPWRTYAVSMLFFGVAGFVTLYALQRLQWYLPFNPQGQAGVEQVLAFNTSVSFVTNTNWQSYAPETTMGYLVQMAGLTVHNFVSAAVGIALALALIRGFVRREASGTGNFWVDLTRCTLYILLPISVITGLFLVWQGVPQNLSAYVDATTLEGAKQTIGLGSLCRNGYPAPPRCDDRLLVGSARQSCLHRIQCRFRVGRSAGGGQHGGQGGPLRHHSVCAICNCHHGRGRCRRRDA